jgi:flagellar hook-associated protein 2
MQAADQATLTPYNNQIQTDQNKISAWTTFASQLTSLQTASNTLQSATGMDLYSATVGSSSSISASSLLSATASSSASTGSYNVVINNTAQAEQLASASFSSASSALSISGTILVNGHAVQIAATDTLQGLSSKINNLDSGTQASGVTASIIRTSSTGYRLVLTSDNTGAAGFSLLNGSTSDTLASLGFNTTVTSIKNQIAGGAQSDAFSSSSTSVEAMLGNESNDLSGTVTINGKTAAIDLTDTLSTIQADFAAAGISASIVSSTNGSQTAYRLQIAGMTNSNYTDQNNILQSLGLIQGNRTDESEVTGNAANTTDGSTPITSSTNITSIHGYNTYTAGDQITISGTAHDGTAVAATNLAITGDTTVGNLLNQIQSLFGNVTASVASDGRIQVIDNATGTSKLSVNLSTSLGDSNSQLSFGSFGQVLQQGEDASFTIDGMGMTSSTNTVTTAIQGVTLNLLGADPNTTLTLTVGHDVQGIENEINTMISAYNGVMSYVNTQMSYNTQTQQTGGPLFGNSTLTSIKSQLQSAVLTKVGTGTFQYLSQIGITQGANAQLSLDTTTFANALSRNFNDVFNLLSDTAVTSDSQFQYVYNNGQTQSGTYSINISRAAGTGQNVAGQIDGQDASGQGNVLTLNNTASKANGLEVSYTGTSNTASATITVNRGIASLVDSLVKQFTDSVKGSVTVQQNGLQTNISSLTQQISRMQDSINQQIANMKTEFENMDVAVAQMYLLQSYLTAQFANL